MMMTLMCVDKDHGSRKSQPEEKEDDLNATDDGESSEEAHGASNET